jgi:putative DNA primase/helicase
MRDAPPSDRFVSAYTTATGWRVDPARREQVVRCPAHDDRTPSLSVGVRPDGAVVLNCHAGCPLDDVVTAIGLTRADLRPESPNGNGGMPIVASYPYVDGLGTLLFTVHRFVPKSFRQQAADGTWSTRGVRRVLYRLPDVVRAVKDGVPVWVVEGEKDADTLASLGMTATTVPGGAGKWRPEYADALTGAGEVHIVADDDDPGRKHAAQVAEALRPVAGSVSVWLPAEGKDVSDHLSAGLDLAKLRPFETSANAPETISGPVLVTLASVAPEPVTWLWAGYLPAGKLVIIDGDPGVGKSTVTLDVAARVTSGSPMPDGSRCERPGAVLLLSAEDGLSDTIRPRLEAAGGDASRVHALTEIRENDGSRPVEIPADVPTIRSIIERRGITLIVIDPLMAFLGGQVNSKTDHDIRRALHPLADVATATGATIIIVRHLNKSSGGNALYRGGGSIGIIGAARAAFIVGKDPDDENRRIMAGTKFNLGPEPPALAYSLVSAEEYGCARVEWQGATEHRASDILRDENRDDPEEARDAAGWLREFLMASGGEATPEDVVNAGRRAGFSPDALKRAKKRAGVRSEKLGLKAGWIWRIITESDDRGARDWREDSRREHEGGEERTSTEVLPSRASVLPSPNPNGQAPLFDHAPSPRRQPMM